MNKSDKILVTRVSGFIGSQLVKIYMKMGLQI